jgi:hypothetical protein
VFSDAVSIRAQAKLEGDLGSFGAGRVKVSLENDRDLVSAAMAEAGKDPGVPVLLLDDRNRKSSANCLCKSSIWDQKKTEYREPHGSWHNSLNRYLHPSKKAHENYHNRI